MGQNINVNLIIVLIILFAPVARLLWAKIQRARANRQVRRESERLQEESLRTGRVFTAPAGPGQPPVNQTPEMRTLAERRQAQIRALREQQANRGRQIPPRTTVLLPTSPGYPTTLPGAPFRPVAAPPGARPTPGAPVPVGVPVRQAQRGRQSPPARREAQRGAGQQPFRGGARGAPPPQAASGPERTTLREAPVTESAPPAPRPSSEAVLGGTLGVDDLRRAVVLREILDPPLAMREGEG